jgi:phosphatidylglycerophosphate synthase
MLDARLRVLVDPLLTRVASHLVTAGVSANTITLTGFLVGMSAVPLIAIHYYLAALMAILANRVLDGLDGAVAKQAGATDLGGYLDIVLDFIFYSAVILGFTLALPDQAIYGAFLIFSFVGTGSSFLAFAIFAEKRGISSNIHGSKSLYYLGGLTEGTETILLFILLCVFPGYFHLFAMVFGLLCWLTTISRIQFAYLQLK